MKSTPIMLQPMMGKCLQFASGGMYLDPEDRTKWEVIHKVKVGCSPWTSSNNWMANLYYWGIKFRHDAEAHQEAS